MNRACGTNRREEICTQRFGGETLKEKPLKRPRHMGE